MSDHSFLLRLSMVFTVTFKKVKTFSSFEPLSHLFQNYSSLVNAFFLWRCDPTRVIASSFLMFLDHTQRRTTVGRTPLNEWSARRRDLYLTTHDTHNRQISKPPGGIRTHDLSSLRVNQLLYCVSLKIYNKFANYFCELKFSGNTHQRP